MVNLLKRIPVKYKGELHDIRLVNFSVDMHEVKDHVPKQIQVRNFDGRALISMVDVKLRKMHPDFIPSVLNFNYRHIAFRLLIEDSMYNKRADNIKGDGINKGIFFYRSFTDRPLIISGGRLFTDYNLEYAELKETGNTTSIFQKEHYVRYTIGNSPIHPERQIKDLQNTVGALDRAYSVLNDRVRVTQIQREKWPIQVVECSEFENTFFRTARLEAAFRVFETIYYQWLPPKIVNSEQ